MTKPTPEWLNYHHLLYFSVVAREGTVAGASKALRLAQPTISGQLRALEEALGEKLFDRSGRRLVLTEMGRTVQRYADEIFSLGRELVDTVKGRPTGRPIRLRVGVATILPKLVVRRLLDVLFEPSQPVTERVQVVCHEDRPERLLADLSLHALDVVLSDGPVAPGGPIRAFGHLLGECGVQVFGTPELAGRYRAGFPRSLDGAPMLLPADNTALRHALNQWFTAKGVRPEVIAELDDSSLLEAFGARGRGLFVAPTVIADEVEQQYGVERLGRLDGVRERFYAISIERKLTHPAVVALSRAARDALAR